MISILKPIKLFVLTVALLLSFVSELDSIGSKHFFKANPENPETASLIPLDYFRSKGINIDESSNLNLYRY
ncbi:MAG: hypothetical protein Q8880_13600, partial [Bacteroidota bacterium]|nr:hypothetical protein [Bacteroidota bacterium]